MLLISIIRDFHSSLFPLYNELALLNRDISQQKLLLFMLKYAKKEYK